MKHSSKDEHLFDIESFGNARAKNVPRWTEPSVNVMMAQLLSESGLRAKGEVRSYGKAPDIQLDLHGVRIIIEGKFIGQRSSLVTQAKQRLQDGIGEIILLVEYADPGHLNSAIDQMELKEKLRETIFNVSWLTTKDAIDAFPFLFPQNNLRFYNTPFEEGLRFNDIVGRVLSAYETVINEDILARPINQLETTLRMFSQDIALDGNLINLAERLQPILELSKSEESEKE